MTISLNPFRSTRKSVGTVLGSPVHGDKVIGGVRLASMLLELAKLKLPAPRPRS